MNVCTLYVYNYYIYKNITNLIIHLCSYLKYTAQLLFLQYNPGLTSFFKVKIAHLLKREDQVFNYDL